MSVVFRASSIGNLMSYPERNKLPDGAITELDKMVSQKLIKWQDAEFDFFTTEKGKICENESIEIYNEVNDSFYVKNVERIYKNVSTGLIIDHDTGLIFDKSQPVLTGECDILDKANSLVIDIKTAYSKKTYPFNLKISKLYEWQLRAYMYLYDVNSAELAYVLVDTPHDLISNKDPEHWHFMQDVPLEFRVSSLRIERDEEKEQQMLARLSLCENYVMEQITCKSKKV